MTRKGSASCDLRSFGNGKIAENISRNLSTSLRAALIGAVAFHGATDREQRHDVAFRVGRSRRTFVGRVPYVTRNYPRFSPICDGLHLCASCFSCAPPCCESRVTLARTDPLLTLPAAEAAANWHMRTPRMRNPKHAPWWHAETIPVTSSAFASFHHLLRLLLLHFLCTFSCLLLA